MPVLFYMLTIIVNLHGTIFTDMAVVAWMASMYNLHIRAKSIGKHLCWVLLHVDTIACGMFGRTQVHENQYIEQASPGSFSNLKVEFLFIGFHLNSYKLFTIYLDSDFLAWMGPLD